jgi:peptidoglycan-associated lipoprotein
MTRRSTASQTLPDTNARIALAFGLALIVTLAGCQTTSESTEEMEPEPSAGTGSEFSQGETPVADVVEAPVSVPKKLGTTYFDFDRAEIRGDQRSLLRNNAKILMRTGRASVSAIIEGHADERGSEEYNLALGERRAESVRKYLSALGVSRSKLRVVSYGESKPAVAGHDESTWRLNRRAEFRSR